MSASHVEILEQRIVILEDTIQMLSYNLRCLNIRQGSQPIELQAYTHVYEAGRMMPELKLPDIDFDHPCTPDEFENMVDTLVINEDRRYQDMINFGADETAWAK